MRTTLQGLVVIGLVGTAAPAWADLELITKKNCLACHQIDKRKYGPNFKEVAAKYADKKGAAAKLAKKIRSGGTGVWGQDIMPPQPQVSPAEAKTLAEFILSMK